MRSPLTVTVALFALAGCSTKVAIEVPAAPTVALYSVKIQVNAADRACRPLADQVAERIGQVPGMQVDPRAHASLTLYGCTSNLMATDASSMMGSTAALAAMSDRSGVVHILGSARQEFANHPRHRAALQSMYEQVADDLVEQVVPLPQIVQRRVYDNANEGTARALLNQAVRAEQRGKVAEALDFARQAHQLRPRPQRARYVAELTRRLSRTE